MGKSKKKKCKSNLNKSIESSDVENFFETAIRELSFLTQSVGLVVGTNETLRRLERQQLAAVFLFSTKASPSIFHSLAVSCRKTDVPFIILQDKDKFVLGSNFPTSITYAVKKDCLENLPTLRNLLNEIRSRKIDTKPPTIVCDAIIKTPELSKVEEPLQETDHQSFYHKKHAVDSAINTEWTDLDCLSISTSNINFPDYDSLYKYCDFSFSAK